MRLKWVIGFLCCMGAAQAELLNIQLKEGALQKIHLGVSYQGPESETLAKQVCHDLLFTERFTCRIQKNPRADMLADFDTFAKEDALLVLKSKLAAKKLQATFHIWHVTGTHRVPQKVLNEGVTGSLKNTRRLGHAVSDKVYPVLLGSPGIFSSHIAYVWRTASDKGRVEHRLMYAEFDGGAEKTLLTSREPIMSPVFSPDGQSIAYVSFEHKHSQVVLQSLKTGQRQVLARFQGINGAPAWFPDGQALALVRSRPDTRGTDIYKLDLKTGTLSPLVQSVGIDTEPSISPDGNILLWTSERAGAPQIYKKTLPHGQAVRQSFGGGYNADPTWLSNQQGMVFLHRNELGIFDVALHDFQTGRSVYLTENLYAESVCPAPQGGYVLVGIDEGMQSRLAIVSLDKHVTLRLPHHTGSLLGPAWTAS